MPRVLKWVLFLILCIFAWICAAFYLLTIGWASCEVTGRCVIDRIVIGVILLMLPAQVAIAAYMRSEERDAR